MSNENIKVTGHIKWELIRDGKVVQSGERANVVTTAGKDALAALLIGSNAGNTLITNMGFGTGTTAVAASDTTLTTELSGNGYARPAVTLSNPSANVVQAVATLTGITTATTVQEAGLFNAAASGTMIAHQLTGAVNLQSSSDSLQITWQITFS